MKKPNNLGLTVNLYRGEVALIVLLLFLCCYDISAGNSFSAVDIGGATAVSQKDGLRKISGLIVDSNGEPIIGANIIVEGTKYGAITDIDGAFSFEIPQNEGKRLNITYLGFETLYVTLTEKDYYKLVMVENSTLLADVVVVGYGVQRKESVVGAISQVEGDNLVESGNSNITQALSGKLSGVSAMTTSGQPGMNDAEILIRGVSSFSSSKPLVLVDGVERDFASIDPNEVANISVLKDASATAVFGAKGANGVIIVTTKGGFEGKPKMDLSYSSGFSTPINTARHVDSYTTMSLRNVAMMNDMQFEGLMSEAILNEYRHPSNALNALRYPDVDWMKEMTNPFASTINANFNIQGGTKFVKYFASVGYYREGSIFKSFDYGKASTAYSYDRVNFRTNVDFNVTSSTKLFFKLGGSVGVRNQPMDPGTRDNQMWSYINGSSSAKYPMYYPSWVLEQVPDLDYPGASEDRLISEADQATMNPYYAMARGRFRQYTDNKLFSDIILKQDLDFITEGLSVQAKVSLSTYYKYQTLSTDYERSSWVLDFDKIGTGSNPWRRTDDDGYIFVEDPVYTTADNSLSGGYYLDLYYDMSVNYDRTFGRHNVTGLFLFNRQEQNRGSDFPYYNEALVARATYDYAHKYLVEFNMGYTGSERFAPSNRFGFFPSGAIGWVASEEKFFDALKPWFSKLKFRYSAGLVGNDYASSRWLYLSDYSKDDNGYIIEDKVANTSVQWEQSFKQDLGIEMGFFNNDLRVNIDFFDEYRDKMLISVTNNTPIWVGNTSKELNKGAVKKHGFEIEASYDKKFGKDWNLSVGGNFSFNENRIVYADDPPFGLPYQMRIGAPIGAQLNGAYLASGDYLESIDDIHSNFLPISVESLVAGDYKFLDYNSDGIIDKNDLARMEGSLYPPVTYAFNGGFKWKGLSVNVLFQGTIGKYVNFDQVFEWEFYKGNYRTHISSLDYWSPENLDGNHCAVHYSSSTLPNMYWSGSSDSATGGYTGKILGRTWRKSDYLRLKELSVAYTWNGKKLQQVLGLGGLKVYVTGNNLLTFTDLIEGDPEAKYLLWGDYPHMMTIKIGVQLIF